MNEVACIDFFYLERIGILHCIDLITRYLTRLIVESANMSNAIYSLEAIWFSAFWYPKEIQGAEAFSTDECLESLRSRVISFRPVLPGTHSWNMIEIKHPIIRSIILQIKKADRDNIDERSSPIRAITISNDLYENETLFAIALGRDLTKPPPTPNLVQALPDDIVTAYENLQARRKPALILKSKSMSEPVDTFDDTVEVYTKMDFEKQSKRSPPNLC